MRSIAVAVGLWLALAGTAGAQGLDFSGINQGNTAPPAAAAPPPAAAGQGAPYWPQGGWSYSGYNQYYQLQQRFNAVLTQIKYLRGQSGWFSSQRSAYDQAEDYGDRLWRNYSRYQDPNSAWQLQLWLGQWEQYLGSYGYAYGWNSGGSWNTGGWTDGSYGGWNGGWSTGGSWGDPYYGYSLPNYGYYDNYSRWYYGGNNYYYPSNAYANGWVLGNGIGNIVNGSRYHNDLQLTGGILSTIGGSLNLFSGF